jgi:nicotinamide-nucleotide amidase
VNQLAAIHGLDPGFVESIIAALRSRKSTVATAESLTGGLVCAVLTSVPGSSAVVRGGLIVYATELKASLAGVDSAALRRLGAVDPEIASQLATGARERCAATWGLGLTGVAGPDPQGGIAPGTVHVGLAGPNGVEVKSLQGHAGDRHEIRSAAVGLALALLWTGLESSEG